MEEKLAYGGIIGILQGHSSEGMAEGCSMTLTWRRKQKWRELFKMEDGNGQVTLPAIQHLTRHTPRDFIPDTNKRDVAPWILIRKGSLQ